ncbi:CPBP family intramembrane glutamic endopeptidase [Flavilitoribacter nigricans]|uniref:CAAX prenyl protease 2/Lysostaphin resistance protein A-like domain-containing protein n=1 Tax=Flavilitoribacter nigricans (strain ATCC 23147 / DSM 23189 / NBRC 102662 / NCIMB 1420 / SS-2) TaxID=1122177 RepID=A0A2D0MXE7_FLAN2|nr:CPBP family intramembrane glutamic endopeptidase [Flavilitoribacter nigricans]PHN00828.1 hypothetical protein CRP01_40290 [Flavilitoribacter nigricans DSM 23189 = NBRC 102662]
METTAYLFLSLLIATLGFIFWYTLSPSLRLPKRFQIQYDINPAYFNRILRRRLAGFLIYGLLPVLLIFKWKVLGEVRLEDLQISFAWNGSVTFWILILVPLALLFSFLSAGRSSNLIEYPEIRVTLWTPYRIFLSALYWILYLVALEFLFRGLILQSVLMATRNEFAAILVSTGLYAMTHYFKNNRNSSLSIPYGLIMAYVTLASGSLLPAILVHTIGGLTTEWLAIYKHPELQVRFRF